MRLKINIPDLAFAAFLVALGALAFALASQLSMGTTAAMGPGYVPRGLSVVVAVYGLVLGVRAMLSGQQPLPAIEWRPLCLILGAVALFAILLPWLGLAITSFIVVVCAGWAAYDVHVRENVVAALVLAAFATLLFVTALGLPIAVWPW
jgi:hypothetical protein